jgi:hypothetical protein
MTEEKQMFEEWLEKEEDLMEKATPGPWVGKIEKETEPWFSDIYAKDPKDNSICGVATTRVDNTYKTFEDAAFIANVRTSHEVAIHMLKTIFEDCRFGYSCLSEELILRLELLLKKEPRKT